MHFPLSSITLVLASGSSGHNLWIWLLPQKTQGLSIGPMSFRHGKHFCIWLYWIGALIVWSTRFPTSFGHPSRDRTVVAALETNSPGESLPSFTQVKALIVSLLDERHGVGNGSFLSSPSILLRKYSVIRISGCPWSTILCASCSDWQSRWTCFSSSFSL